MDRSELANALLKTPSFNAKGKAPKILILDSSGEVLAITGAVYDPETEDGVIFLKAEYA